MGCSPTPSLSLCVQGAKDIGKIREMVEDVLNVKHTALDYDKGYRVHMAVLTASLGRRVSVNRSAFGFLGFVLTSKK